jgi:molybdopterin converting factor small subunit
VPVEPSSPTVAGALESLWRAYPGIRDRLMNEQGQVREHINVFVGDEDIRYTGGLETPVRDGEQITIVPSISGGTDYSSRHKRHQ